MAPTDMLVLNDSPGHMLLSLFGMMLFFVNNGFADLLLWWTIRDWKVGNYLSTSGEVVHGRSPASNGKKGRNFINHPVEL